MNWDNIVAALDYAEKAEEKRKLADYCLNAGIYNSLTEHSYYYLFNMCRAAMALEEGYTRTHKEMISRTCQVMVKEKHVLDDDFGKFINSLCRLRNQCDYEAGYHIPKELAVKSYEMAIKYGAVLSEYIVDAEKEVEVPNKETIEAIEEARRQDGSDDYEGCVDEFLDKILAEDNRDGA